VRPRKRDRTARAGADVASRIDRELLTQRQRDEGLILATSEEREDATEERESESHCGPHRALDSARVPERKGRLNLIGLWVYPSRTSERIWTKREQNQLGRIMRTDNRRVGGEYTSVENPA
jgi:hypothetical protein